MLSRDTYFWSSSRGHQFKSSFGDNTIFVLHEVSKSVAYLISESTGPHPRLGRGDSWPFCRCLFSVRLCEFCAFLRQCGDMSLMTKRKQNITSFNSRIF
jgi:hypothetical protein